MRPVTNDDLPEGFGERPWHPWALRDPDPANIKRLASGDELGFASSGSDEVISYDPDEGELTVSAGRATMRISANAMFHIFALVAHELDVFAEAALHDEVLAAQGLLANGMNPGEVQERGREFLARLRDKTDSIPAV